MTAISLGHVSRPGRTAMIGAIKAGRFSRGSGRLLGPAQLREQLARFASSQPQESAGGFVDFLLGRIARDPR
jgi:hypothetical protein